MVIQWEPYPSFMNPWLGLIIGHFCLTILGLQLSSFNTIYPSASGNEECFQPLSAHLGLGHVCFWDLLLNELTHYIFFWTLVAVLTLLFWLIPLFKQTDSSWFLSASDCIALLGKTASELYKLNFPKLNSIELNSKEFNSLSTTDL